MHDISSSGIGDKDDDNEDDDVDDIEAGKQFREKPER